MDSRKVIFVTGATGNQGSATAINLAEKGFMVLALVRKINSPNNKKLIHPGIKLIEGDFDEPLSYSQHLKNIDGAFALFTYLKGTKKEIEQARSFIDAAMEMKVPFLLYSSVIGADSNSGIPHWESKNKIEQYIKNSGIHYTIIRPASLYQNFLIPDVRKRLVKGNLVMPVRKDKVQQFIGAEDIGKICTQIFLNPGKYIGRSFSIASDEMDMQSAAKKFSVVLGKPVKYSQLPGLLTRIFMGRDLHTMFSYVNSHDVCFVKNMPELKTEFPFLTPMENWINNNKESFIS